MLVVAVGGKLLGADSFAEYPTIEIGTGATTIAVSVSIVLSGLAPLRRQRRRAVTSLPPSARTASNSVPAGGGI